MDAVALTIRMSADAGDVAAEFDGAGAAALRMGDDVEQASRQADAATSRLDTVADSADQMGSKSAQAAGGLGDLGGALAMLPGPLGAVGAGMEAVAPAVMGVTGAMDLANLAASSNIVVTTRQRAATIAHAVASRTVAAATRTWAAVQWVLNAAMSANPIGIVVVAVAALVAGIILAYKKSETFRNIVDAVMRAARNAVGWVVDKVADLVTLVRDKAVGIWDTLKNKAVAAFEAIMEPIQWVIDKVQKLIDKIESIPGIPGGDVEGHGTLVGDLPSSGRTLPGGPGPAAGGGNVYQVTIPGTLLDPAGTVRALEQLFRDYGFSRGTTSPLTAGP